MSGQGSVSGKVAVVTGAARGVGGELARQLFAAGARVALLGLEPGQLAAVAAGCPGAAWWEVDVTDTAALERVAAEVADRFGRVDVVVANAGIAAGGPLLLADPTAYDRVIEVNLLGSVRTARAFLPHLVTSRGYFLQMASVAAILPAPMMSAYCASKSGVEAFAHSLRAEVRHHGVDVGVGYLSWTDTDMVRGADEQPGLREMRATLPWPFAKTYPLEPAVVHLVRGIAGRRPHVYGQPWLRLLPAARATFPGLVARVGARDMAGYEAMVRDAGSSVTGLVGPGGSAARRVRQ